jgi:hypothetical protein
MLAASVGSSYIATFRWMGLAEIVCVRCTMEDDGGHRKIMIDLGMP